MVKIYEEKEKTRVILFRDFNKISRRVEEICKAIDNLRTTYTEEEKEEVKCIAISLNTELERLESLLAEKLKKLNKK